MMLETEISPAVLAGMIDHTFLKPFGSPADIERLCEDAAHYRFAMVAIHPAELETCVQLLRNTGVGIGAAIGFPLGQNTVETKALETRDAIRKGATEIDTVINIRALQSGHHGLVAREIANMVQICKPAGVITKVILETCYLSDEEKIAACQMAVRGGADFVKTSTGFGTAGATVHDVELMRSVCGPAMGVKASGGVRDLDTALAMIRAGATRIGTSQGVAIMKQLGQLVVSR
jgi:deoxyribose-phosphate aldolase